MKIFQTSSGQLSFAVANVHKKKFPANITGNFFIFLIYRIVK
mgnify:CR=1 FL=1